LPRFTKFSFASFRPPKMQIVFAVFLRWMRNPESLEKKRTRKGSSQYIWWTANYCATDWWLRTRVSVKITRRKAGDSLRCSKERRRRYLQSLTSCCANTVFTYMQVGFWKSAFHKCNLPIAAT